MSCNTYTLKKKFSFSFLRNLMVSQIEFVDKMLIITGNLVYNFGDNLGITKRISQLSLLAACAIISAL
jgi:hypothetical protein